MKRFVRIGMWGVGLVLIGIAGIVVANAGIYLGTYSYIYNSVADAPQAEVALIPGAAVLADGTLSAIFRDRVDTAVALYSAGKVTKILVSGDNSTVNYNEVNPVRLYLIEKGVPDEDIFLDHAGFDTYSTMYRARDVFGVSSILVCTQSFHLPRSLFIARSLGVVAEGVNADVGHILLRNYVREALANQLALFELMVQRVPKYLGEKVPIEGDGRLYP